jgi:hypothetical protein
MSTQAAEHRPSYVSIMPDSEGGVKAPTNQQAPRLPMNLSRMRGIPCRDDDDELLYIEIQHAQWNLHSSGYTELVDFKPIGGGVLVIGYKPNSAADRGPDGQS